MVQDVSVTQGVAGWTKRLNWRLAAASGCHAWRELRAPSCYASQQRRSCLQIHAHTVHILLSWHRSRDNKKHGNKWFANVRMCGRYTADTALLAQMPEFVTQTPLLYLKSCIAYSSRLLHFPFGIRTWLQTWHAHCSSSCECMSTPELGVRLTSKTARVHLCYITRPSVHARAACIPRFAIDAVLRTAIDSPEPDGRWVIPCKLGRLHEGKRTYKLH